MDQVATGIVLVAWLMLAVQATLIVLGHLSHIIVTIHSLVDRIVIPVDQQMVLVGVEAANLLMYWIRAPPISVYRD